MTFDEYITGLMTLNLEHDKDIQFLFRQLTLLKETKQTIAIKIIVQTIVNLKFSKQGLIE